MRTLLFFAFLLTATIRAQEIPFSYLPEPGNDKAESHIMVIPVQIGGVSSSFIFDTGAGVHLISSRLAQQLGCPSTGVTHSGQRMSGQQLNLPLTWIPRVDVGATHQQFVVTAVLDFKGFLPETPAFEHVDGLLSLLYFRSLPFTLDSARRTLVFETPDSLAERARTGQSIPLKLQDEEGVSLTVSVPLQVGSELIEVEVDSGSGSLILDDDLLPRHPATDTRVVQGKDETGNSYTRTFGRLKEPLTLAPGYSVPPGSSVQFQNIIHQGLIGDGALRRFTVTFDLPHSRLILNPRTTSASVNL